jgi:hypothetical protein
MKSQSCAGLIGEFNGVNSVTLNKYIHEIHFLFEIIADKENDHQSENFIVIHFTFLQA